ncbi:trypsin-1-like [Maniola hyperantus]|uniref:trypsin-1-like n=1 Tax=Aphantopus hyperantus TaxID=2795564 RepID=UPI003749D0CB
MKFGSWWLWEITEKHVVENGPVTDKREGRIAGGVAVESITEFPYVVQVLKPYHCSGAIISKNYILTAAQCIEDEMLRINWTAIVSNAEVLARMQKKTDPKEIEVRAGSQFRGEGTLIPIAKAVRHPYFRIGANYDSDIAYLKTVSPIAFNENVQPGILTDDPLEQPFLTVTGWGEQTYAGPESCRTYSYVLRGVELEAIPPWDCEDIYQDVREYITVNMLCAEETVYHDKGACDGDRGAPLTLDSKIYGISSHTYYCGPGMYPSIFTYLRAKEIREFVTKSTGVQYVKSDKL